MCTNSAFFERYEVIFQLDVNPQEVLLGNLYYILQIRSTFRMTTCGAMWEELA